MMLIVICIFLVIGVIAFGNFFFTTGGGGLARVTWYYLLQNIPDRQYGWQDFTDRGSEQNISGFYSSSNENSLSIWTLSGLKTFGIDPGVSEYNYSMFCEAVSNVDLSMGTAYRQLARDVMMKDFSVWRNYMKSEYFITVQREPNNKNIISKLWSRSGKYKIIDNIDLETCK